MLTAIIRVGVLVGATSAVAYVAKRFWGSDFDRAVDKSKSVAKSVADDITETDEIVNASIRNHI